MKEIDILLQKYASGELTPEELDKLNRLTHRDRVVSAAGAQAHQMKRKQWTRVSVMASVLIVASVGMALYQRPDAAAVGNAPVVAQTVAQPELKSAEAVSTAVAAEPQTVTPRQMAAKVEPLVPAATPTAAAVEHAAEEPEQDMMPVAVHVETEAIVACNTQCSPDSVISDIWKFLKA